jgi:hypothetical protein
MPLQWRQKGKGGARTEGERGGVDEREQHQQRRLPLLPGAPRRRVADGRRGTTREIARGNDECSKKLKVNRTVLARRMLTQTTARRRRTAAPWTRSELVEKVDFESVEGEERFAGLGIRWFCGQFVAAGFGIRWFGQESSSIAALNTCQLDRYLI